MTSKELFIHCVEQRDGIFLEREKRQIIEDLEDYEGLLKIMGTPIQKIMKRLKVLEILKNRSYIIWVEKGVLYSGRDGDIQVPLDKEDFESEEDYKLIKEWLNE